MGCSDTGVSWCAHGPGQLRAGAGLRTEVCLKDDAVSWLQSARQLRSTVSSD